MALLIGVTDELAKGKVAEIVNRLNTARETGVVSWSLTALVFQAYDELDQAKEGTAVVELVNWYAQELLGRSLFVTEINRTGQIIRRYGRIGLEALDYACGKPVKDVWAYAFKVAEAEYRRVKNGN